MSEKKQLTVLITGASSGIGAATAKAIAKEWNEAHLILVARRIDRLEDLKCDLRRQFEKIKISIVELDIRRAEMVHEMLLNNDQFNPYEIDVLINNAGLAAGVEPLVEGSVDNWERMIDTNIKGLLYVTRVIGKIMKEKGHGHIINLSSVAGKDPYVGGNVYCATKFGVEAITRSMRQELVPYGIKVSSIAPGAVNTEFSCVRYDGNKDLADKVYDGFEPLYAEDIAKCILFMISLPRNVNIADMTVLPLSQADARMIYKKQ